MRTCIWILSALMTFTHGFIMPGSLEGFLSVADIENVTNALLSNYSSILTRDTSKGFQGLLLTNSSAYPNTVKPIVVIAGGLSSGYPMTTFEVLYLVDYLAFQYTQNDSSATILVDTFQFYFIPILNIAAYQMTEKLYNQNKTFYVFNTDLSGDSIKCNNLDVGINPNRNFPYAFVPGTNECSSDYAGKNPGSSNITKAIMQAFYRPEVTQAPPGFPPGAALMFLFHEDGNTIATPFASSQMPIDPKRDYYYNNTQRLVPKDFTFNSLANITNKNITGTLLDYELNTTCLSFQIGLAPTNTVSSTNINELAYKIYPFLLVAVQEQNVYITATYLNTIEVVCQVNCSEYSEVSFVFSLKNNRIRSYVYNFEFYPNFDDDEDFIFSSVNVSTYAEYDGSIRNYVIESTSTDNQTNSRRFTNEVLLGYTRANLSITYKKKERDRGSEIDSDFEANFMMVEGYLYFPDLNITQKKEREEDDDGGDGDSPRRNAMAIGLILLILLLIALAIAGCILGFTRKKLVEQQANFSPDPNFANPLPPRI